MQKDDEKIFYQPGDIVRLKAPQLENRPAMLVLGKVSNVFKHQGDSKGNVLKGIKCIWFSTTKELQEGVFNTKDLEFV